MVYIVNTINLFLNIAQVSELVKYFYFRHAKTPLAKGVLSTNLNDRSSLGSFLF